MKKRAHNFAQYARQALLAAVWFCRMIKTPLLRTMRQFAEEELVHSTGPAAGRKYRVERLPHSGLYLDAVDSGRWNDFNATGPRQSTKTFTCFTTPVLYHLFEIREDVIVGLPDMDMAGDKWRKDLLPAIKRSRYADQLPTKGGGSRGGKVESIEFLNGATLKFMSAGGASTGRIGYTARILVVTERDGIEKDSGKNIESDKLTQMEECTSAFDEQARIYKEGTLTTEEGGTWQDHVGGTESEVSVECPACKKWMTPGRANLIGWQKAESAYEARKNGRFICLECGAEWTEQQRVEMNQGARLVHRGDPDWQPAINPERFKDSKPIASESRRFSMRWSAFNKLFTSVGSLAEMEWDAARAEDQDNAEKKMCQYVWALPHKSPLLDLSLLDSQRILQKAVGHQRGIVPREALCLTVYLDIHQLWGYWVAIAWSEGMAGHIVEYDVFEIPKVTEDNADAAIKHALWGFKEEYIDKGWQQDGGGRILPAQVWIDARWKPHIPAAFCRENGERYRSCMGYSTIQGRGQGHWRNIDKRTADIRYVGTGFYLKRSQKHRTVIVHINADYFKRDVQERFAAPKEKGGFSIFEVRPKSKHHTFAKHIIAEIEVEDPDGKRYWKIMSRNNHYLDVCAGCTAAGRYVLDMIARQAKQGQAGQGAWDKSGKKGRW